MTLNYPEWPTGSANASERRVEPRSSRRALPATTPALRLIGLSGDAATAAESVRDLRTRVRVASGVGLLGWGNPGGNFGSGFSIGAARIDAEVIDLRFAGSASREQRELDELPSGLVCELGMELA